MTSRRIRLSFTAHGVAAEATLLEERAPATCEALWAALPLSGVSHHATYSGSECVLVLPQIIRTPPEQPTSDVAVGDVAFTWFAAGAAYGVERDFAEIAWFYDRDARPSMHEGPAPMTVFARIDGPADDFYAACRRMRRAGVHAVAVERVEPDPLERTSSVVFRPEHGAAADPHVASAGDVLLVAFTVTTDAAAQHDPRSLPMLARSDDGGRTWSSAPLGPWLVGGHVTGLAANADTISATIGIRTYTASDTVADASWDASDSALGWWSRPTGNVGLASRDGGHSWQPASAHEEPAPAHDLRVETEDGAVVYLGDGGDRSVIRDVPGMPARSARGVALGDDHAIVVYDAWDGLPGSDPVTGVRGIHATRFRLPR